MSLTTISGSLGLRVGDGRSSSSSSSKKMTSAELAFPAKTLSMSNIISNSSAGKMTVVDGGGDGKSLPVPTVTVSQPTTPVGGIGGTTSTTSSVQGPGGVDPPSVPPPSGSRVYGDIVLTLENVLLPMEKISPTPSSLDGLDPELEMDLRIAGCELISSSGILLKLPQTAMATGQVLFQRFYFSKSFLRQDMELTAMACIYLASKIEEAPRRIRDVINVFHHIKQLRNGKPLDPMILDQSYIRLKSDVTLAERRVLKELGFCVHVKHPHKLIVVYMQQLGCDKDSNFVQRAWNFMSDALRTSVFVRYTPEAIACSCIYLSARQLSIPLPTSPSWYLVFDVQEEQIVDICESILDLYERPKVSYEAIGKRMNVLVKEFKESRQSHKSSSGDKLIQGISTVTISPNSRPASPNPGSDSSVSNVKTKENMDTDRPKADKRKNEDDPSGKKIDMNSPQAKKARRSPSPIVFNDSPQRHKKKKRRKSRSESISPARSRDDRKSSKKHVRRERSRSRSPYSPKRHHHKKSKTHQRDRYRSRSRSYSPVAERDRYDRVYEKQYYKKSSSKSAKHPRDREEESISSKNRPRDKDRR